MWICKTCGESSDNNFDACWNCGTSMQGVPDPMFAESDKCELSPRRSNGDAANAPVKSFMIVASIILVLLAFFNMHRADRLLARGWHFLVGFQDVDVSQWGNRVSYIDLEGEAWITPFFGGKFVPSEMEETKQPVFFCVCVSV